MAHLLDWDSLLSSKRASKADASTTPEDARSPFESDYDRVVFSSPFRRLARKTQVHPLAANDHVHNRLTHSIEVASVGRSLGRRLVAHLKKTGPCPAQVDEIPCIAQVACLAHDIGNPPYGHAGEEAIREWCATHPDIVFGLPGQAGSVTSEALRRDILHFEGNAQGFRMIARPDNPRCGYLRLTYASIGAMVKYPWSSASVRASRGKFNCFDSERDLFTTIFSAMGLSLGNGEMARHPLSFLTEAADDVCYRIIDMEDAVAMRIFQEGPIRDLLEKLSGLPPSPTLPLSQLRGLAIRQLLDQAWQVFQSDYDTIMHGGRFADLKSGFAARTLDLLHEVDENYERIFAHRTKIAHEFGAYRVLGRILKELCSAARALCLQKAYDPIGFVAKRCMELTFGDAYAAQHATQPYDWWLGQVIDYVAGLTDTYAMQLSREIEGV